MKNTSNLQKNQSGLVSIVITLIIMAILSLIVVGFAQLSRKEQREALDRQLASQAQYAAESGINDVKRLIANSSFADLHLNDVPNQAKTTCDPDLESPGDKSNYLDSTGNVKYTCVLIKSKQEVLITQNAKPERSTVMPIIRTGGGVGENLTISWQSKTGTQDGRSAGPPVPPDNSFPDFSSWGDHISMMRFDLTEADTMSNLAENNFTFFGYPSSDTTVTGMTSFQKMTNSPGEQGKIVNANCDPADSNRQYRCRVTITGIDASKRHYLRYKPLYKDSEVATCWSLLSGACDPSKTLDNAQWTVDVTGQAADILKRIQIRLIPTLSPGSSLEKPEFAMDGAESICKLLEVSPTTGTNIDSCH